MSEYTNLVVLSGGDALVRAELVTEPEPGQAIELEEHGTCVVEAHTPHPDEAPGEATIVCRPVSAE